MSDPSQICRYRGFQKISKSDYNNCFLLQARSLLSNGHGPNTGNQAYTGYLIAICKNITILFFNIYFFGNRCLIHIIFVALIIRINIKKILLCDKHQLTVGHGNGKAEGESFSDRDTVIISQHEVIFFSLHIHSFI